MQERFELAGADRTTLVADRQGSGPPVVLIHGSSGGLDSWAPVLPWLTGSFETWVYARRGYPPSGAPHSATSRPLADRPETNAGTSLADQVADLAAIIEATGGRAHVVGASFGALVGLQAALDHPELLTSLAVFEPPLYSLGPAMQPVLQRYQQLLHDGELALAARLFAEQVARVPAALLDASGAAGDEPDPDELLGCLSDLQAMTGADPELSRFAGIDLPVLLLQGELTWSPMPQTMDALAAALPTPRREVLAGQAHFATHTAPEAFTRELLGFLRS